MDNVIGIAFVTLVAVQFLVTVLYLISAGQLLRRLKTNHTAVHESIGSPLLIANNTARNNLLFFRWIWNREFETLGDSSSIALSRRVRTLLVCLIIGFALAIVLFILAFAVS